MTKDPSWKKLLESCGFKPSSGPHIRFDNMGEPIPGVEANYMFSGSVCTVEVVMHIADMEPEDLKELMLIFCRQKAELDGTLHARLMIAPDLSKET